ncbi:MULTISPECIES: alpha/beta fold hydrolase [Mycobacteroides]|uniref:Bromoperoxidase n=1 Tax=Mycobacteroides chelonae TaxID=1774 RepID=A0A1S1LKS8_MYCCH|nr:MULTISPECIES: alpha/beta hydrolase [Mycobacteroides]KRQ18568.1 bromoperoxidase [Mycobacteroides sp. H003]KRQ21901.1 bromoperoxidase [Mycobacteroides sp. H092]KRQ46099.1 bromoperoxidase [Mycobacteroides sp. H101]KRQ49402.1 bromoperoxidase [Mycobacteroides sp. H063]KRQ52290.1 bromoperoxidase [Mycobacteroides sp. HXVII]
MPLANINGIQISYDDRGPLALGASGDPVVFISGRGGAGRSWHLHQVPAFRAAGYRTITYNNRGIPPTTECADGFTLQDMVADAAALIESLGAAPARLVGFSMGALIAQELALTRPDLVTAAVFMGTRGREDSTRSFFRKAELELSASGVQVPAAYQAAMRLLLNFSPKTLNNDAAIKDWIDMFTLWPEPTSGGIDHQRSAIPAPDRPGAYSGITVPSLVIGFSDDMTLPPYLGREVAEAIPGGTYVEIADAGHLGFIERPDEVNRVILEFFASASQAV